MAPSLVSARPVAGLDGHAAHVGDVGLAPAPETITSRSHLLARRRDLEAPEAERDHGGDARNDESDGICSAGAGQRRCWRGARRCRAGSFARGRRGRRWWCGGREGAAGAGREVEVDASVEGGAGKEVGGDRWCGSGGGACSRGGGGAGEGDRRGAERFGERDLDGRAGPDRQVEGECWGANAYGGRERRGRRGAGGEVDGDGGLDRA